MANKKAEKATYTCVSCIRTLEQSRNFYQTASERFKHIGTLPYCKDCIKNDFLKSYRETGNVKQSVLATCMRYDVPYDDRFFIEYTDEHLSEDEAKKIWFEYIKMANSIHKKLGGQKSCDYEGLAEGVLQIQKEILDEDEKLYLSENDNDIVIGKEEIAFFGQGFSRKQYIFLTKSYLSLVQSFDIPNSIVANMCKDLCFLDLKIDESKHDGTDFKTIDSLMNARRKLYSDSGIEIYRRDDESSKTEGIGAMIKRMEQNRPAADPLPEWDNNKLEKIAKIVAGHLMYGEGENNEIVEDYLEIVEPYSVDIPAIMGGEEDESE